MVWFNCIIAFRTILETSASCANGRISYSGCERREKSKDEGEGMKDEMERLSCLHPIIHYSIRAAASTSTLGAISDLRFGTVIK
jgi:hypothetical protein